MSMSETVEQIFAGLQHIVEHIEKSARTEAQAELVLQTAGTLLTQLIHSPAWAEAGQIARDIVAHHIEDDLFSPCKFAAPAHDLLDSCDQLEQLGNQLVVWSRDPRFRWKPPLPWILKLELRVPPADIRRELVGAAKAIMMEMRRNQVVFQEITGLRDVRQRVVPVPPLALPGSPGTPPDLVPVPRRPYQSTAKQIKDLQLRIMILGIRIASGARKSRELINQGSIGTQAYQPGNVIMQASMIGDLCASAFLTCMKLATLAM